jgi:hypothetical protein
MVQPPVVSSTRADSDSDHDPEPVTYARSVACPHADARGHRHSCAAHANCKPGSDPDTCGATDTYATA